ncbi:flagellar hook-associated protein FlgK [Celeribacter indicus]|uniref:Flagellar hook-associated protein 1 n=1 Tax=Celeribacter indicus TaxID=1208324 RepID=A0A0B5DX61_9RHOB|nr:flagellar hook-associated protein FlgK [Celeribacter indicus]AJE44832.1 flagellar hook-associated protein FlgK [Celeribacter indicus]SDX24007.1 flagellar hook-associated protein 1 FlgK [Celeribacter indicus]
MSISNALANALTGLNAVSRAADVVSSNVANALTEGYGRREIELTSTQTGRSGSGVAVVGVSRYHDPVTTGERRLADAERALEDTRAGFFAAFATAMGRADEAHSVGGRITGLETALIEAASRPDSPARLASVLDAAEDLTARLNSASDDLMDLRISADRQIGQTVDLLQSTLDQVVELNVAIRKQISNGYDANTLMDQRQVLIDRIAEIVPVTEIPRENGMVALYTTGGAALVESKAATVSFTATPTITPDMTLANGALSGLSINGMPVSTDAGKGAIAGGKLAGLFELRDELAPQAQKQLDALARDLIERFATTDADPTLAPGAAGLFTDGGLAFDALSEEGLAGRISVNALVKPAAGGDLWRLRDGLGAAAEGEQGDATILSSLSGVLRATRVASSGDLVGIGRTALGFASDIYSLVETSRLHAEAELTHAAARQQTLHAIELENGVDTDHEMQQLLVIEQSYAANAKVIETIQALMDQLMRI